MGADSESDLHVPTAYARAFVVLSLRLIGLRNGLLAIRSPFELLLDPTTAASP
jgi:hypothetical protein